MGTVIQMRARPMTASEEYVWNHQGDALDELTIALQPKVGMPATVSIGGLSQTAGKISAVSKNSKQITVEIRPGWEYKFSLRVRHNAPPAWLEVNGSGCTRATLGVAIDRPYND